MRSYCRLKRVMALLLGGYFIGGMLCLKSTADDYDHPFPLFAWNMFAWVPNEGVYYDLVIYRWRGNKLSAPISLARTPQFVGSPAQMTVQQAIEEFGEALSSGDKARGRMMRRLIEDRFLEPPFSYELIEESANPVARLKGEPSLRRRVLAFGEREQRR